MRYFSNIAISSVSDCHSSCSNTVSRRSSPSSSLKFPKSLLLLFSSGLFLLISRISLTVSSSTDPARSVNLGFNTSPTAAAAAALVWRRSGSGVSRIATKDAAAPIITATAKTTARLERGHHHFFSLFPSIIGRSISRSRKGTNLKMDPVTAADNANTSSSGIATDAESKERLVVQQTKQEYQLQQQQRVWKKETASSTQRRFSKRSTGTTFPHGEKSPLLPPSPHASLVATAATVPSSPSSTATATATAVTAPLTRSTELLRRRLSTTPLLQMQIQKQRQHNAKINNEQQQQRHHFIASLVAGVGSGTIASIVCAPLDLIRTRMQVMGALVKSQASSSSSSSLTTAAAAAAAAANNNKNIPHSLNIYNAIKEIYMTDGIKGCFRGLGATLATVPAFWGLYFPLYEVLKKELHSVYKQQQQQQQQQGREKRYQYHQAGGGTTPRGGEEVLDHDNNNNNKNDMTIDKVPSMVHMSSAILAGAVADFVCNPMFVVRTRMQTEAMHYMEYPLSERKPHNVLQTIRILYKEGGGLPIFWRGLTASLMGLSHVAIQFPVYELLKEEARARSPDNKETAADLLVASGVSKLCACLVTYPHEVIRSRMMDARGVEGGRSLIETTRQIISKEGYGALYTGLHVSLLRVVPNCCITFMTYELILRWAKENVVDRVSDVVAVGE